MPQKLYKDFFNIDPKYYASVTADLIDQKKVSWEGFYPHETFIKLLETTYKVLSGSATRSIWVEGSYGTGKSHAALTVKSLLDATDQEVINYFDDYGLSTDLRDRLIAVKNAGKIITVHRIGSAGINTDLDLILAVQQSIVKALEEHGITNQGDASMRDAFLKWVKKSANKSYFSALISDEQFAFKFSGLSADDVINRLENGSQSQVESLMRDVMLVLKAAGQYGIFSDVNDMAGWIESVIQENNLSAILFVWDEFSEYFQTHPVGLTGFQTLAEISLSKPFYFMIVAHESHNLFADRETAKKTLDRFETPVKIELPDNMAFMLMAQAMKKSSDPLLRKQWESDSKVLNEDLISARNSILSKSKKGTSLGSKTMLTDEQLQSIIPIHPYAALILKYIATVFTSNQRSMFDFIISNDMEDAKAFKWYINTYGPDDELNLLTVDLLWDFFYGKGQNGLNDDVRGVLDSYNRLQSDKLLPEEKRVLKTILLLQAISLRVSNNELLSPNKENLDLAFSGTDWSKGKAIQIATGLKEKGIIFEKPVAGGKLEYCVANGGGESIEPFRKKARDETKTQGLIQSAELMKAIQLPASIQQRFRLEGAGHGGFPSVYNKQKGLSAPERFKGIVTFAMNDEEAQLVHQQIIKQVNMPNQEVFFIETLSPMGKDLYDQYIDNLAFNMYYANSDHAQARHYGEQAKAVLREWNAKVAQGAFMLYDADRKAGQRIANLAGLQQELADINHQKYYYGLEQFSLNGTLFNVYQPAKGAEFGITETLSGAYSNSNKKMSVENALEGAWKVPEYWKDPAKQNLVIVHIKKHVDELIQKTFDSGADRISILSILESLEAAPYGFMPSGISALVLGFVLKEYVSDAFFWSNGSLSEAMTVDKMKTMIGAAITQKVNPSKTFREEYIVTMSANLRSFLRNTARVFRVHASQCGSVESARDQVRMQMKKLSFPIWCIKYSLADTPVSSSAELLERAIDDYTGIANTANSSKDSESMLAEDLGKLFQETPAIAEDLERLLTSEQCQKGMLAFIREYRNGLLPSLASQIGDGGKFLDAVKGKFNAGDANWVWNRETAEEKISDVILEYQIVAESNKSLSKCTNLRDTVDAWNRRTNNIRIPCDAVAKLTGDLAPLLEQLSKMKKTGTLAEQDKQPFYALLLTQRENFDHFYNDQVPYFAQDAEAFLSELSSEEISDLYESFPAGQFTKGKSEYYQFVEGEVKKFLQSQWRKKLLELWSQKTQSKDPEHWSELHETPILCMFDDTERSTAKKMFRTIMNKRAEEAEAKIALEYLDGATFYDRLADEKERDRCFMERIVGGYSVLLHDIGKIRAELMQTAHDRPYDWMDNRSIQNQLKKMSDRQYKLTGCDRAMEVIESMDPAELRRYLRERIQDDPDFGLQILKGE